MFYASLSTPYQPSAVVVLTGECRNTFDVYVHSCMLLQVGILAHRLHVWVANHTPWSSLPATYNYIYML